MKKKNYNFGRVKVSGKELERKARVQIPDNFFVAYAMTISAIDVISQH